MSQSAVAGKVQEYISNIEFSLNFEDQKKSTRVRIGDLVHFDGVTAKHINTLTGMEVSGKAVPLKSAINNNWLTLKGIKITGPINVKAENYRGLIPKKESVYDPLSGGSFEDFVAKEGIASSHPRQVVKEEDQVVKKTESLQSAPVKKTTEKLELAKDQVDVRTVTSSTSSLKSTPKIKPTVIQSDDGSGVIVSQTKATIKTQTKKAANTFTVDGSTPTLPIDATINEIRRATAPVEFDEAQDAKVVKKVGPITKMPEEPNEQEGIILKKTDFKKTASGSTPVADLSGVKTQEDVDQIEQGLDQKEVSKTTETEKKNYIGMLPEDWATLHWVKKEKFILAIDDKDFLKFIMNVESTKAVIAACRKRMLELEKQNHND